MNGLFSVKIISEKLGISERGVLKRANKEGWEFRLKEGSRKKYYNYNSLPDNIKLRLAAAESDSRKLTPVERDSSPAALSKQQIDKAMLKADLLRHYTTQLKSAAWGKKDAARTSFMTAYNSSIAYPHIYEALGRLSWKTIEQWKREVLTTGDTFSLADRRGQWRQKGRAITEEQQKILLRCGLHPNRPRISEIIRLGRAVMASKGIDDDLSDATYRRFLCGWRDNNKHIWVFSRQGAKAWNDECAMHIERDYDMIQVGDILVADGHTLNFEILNPWTGQPKRMIMILWYDMKSNFPLGWEIMPTENTRAIASALRRAILRLGKIPQVAYLDNGKAFSARFFNGADLEKEGYAGLFERLGIKTIFAWPYHGQSKTVERFFGSFAELERFCPTYTGTSIEKKPPRMLRGERLHRRVYDKMTRGQCLTLIQAHQMVAAWFDEYARRPQKGHLKGLAPIDLFVDGKGPGIDHYELAFLMMDEKSRRVHRNGIRFLGQNYYSPELYGLDRSVNIRYDLQDPSFIYVFDIRGEFICEARPVDKVHPAATVLGTAADREKLREHIAAKKRQEKEAAVSARAFLENEVIPEHHQRMEALGLTDEGPRRDLPVLPQETKAEKNARILAELAELEEMNRGLPQEETAEEKEARIMADVAAKESEAMDAADLRHRLEKMGDTDRYETLLDMDALGQMIPRKWRTFMEYYELTEEYACERDYFQERRALLASSRVSSGDINGV